MRFPRDVVVSQPLKTFQTSPNAALVRLLQPAPSPDDLQQSSRDDEAQVISSDPITESPTVSPMRWDHRISEVGRDP